MECVWYFGGIWCKVTEHGVTDTGLALGDSGESNLLSPLPRKAWVNGDRN